jgi:hypothetical protein
VPYRKSQQAKPKRRAKSAPVLDELIRQFSDRYAFLRELVQNAIDAGGTRVRVWVTREGDDRTTFVEDDGSGMSLDVIKGPFLTKFSSSKEGDDTKIGRYGVGFLSVFALGPRLVMVETETDDSAFSIELDPSFAFRVSKRPPLGKKGTRIAIVESIVQSITEPTADGATSDAQHLALLEAALTRWCRYATIRIDLTVGDETRSINRELELNAPVTVAYDKDGIRVLVGPSAGTKWLPGSEESDTGDFAGFSSRGLTLIEASSGPHVLDGLRYRVECSKLMHTISRDDVVRNSAYERAKAIVRELGDAQVPNLVETTLRKAALDSARSGIIDARFPALLVAGQRLLRDECVLVPTVGDSGALPINRIDARAPAKSAHTEELRSRGLRVALDPTGNAGWLPESIKPADSMLTMVHVGRAPPSAFAGAVLRALWQMGLCLDGVLLTEAQDVDGLASRIVHDSDLRPQQDGSLHLFLPVTEGRGDELLLLFTQEPALAAAMRLPDARGALLAARLVWLEQRGELPRRVNLSLLDASRAAWGDA